MSNILGDFNVNVLFKRKYILNKPKEIKIFYKEFSPDIRKYTELC